MRAAAATRGGAGCAAGVAGAIAVAAALFAHPTGSAAQTAPRSGLPDARLDAPILPAPEVAPAPPLAVPQAPPRAAPSAADIRLTLRTVVLTPKDAPLAATPGVAAAIDAALGREADLASLETLRRKMTEALVREGYVSSGFRLREVDLDVGSATYEIVEGRLTEIFVAGEGIADGERRIGEASPDDVRARVAPGPGAFDVDDTQEALRILLRDRNVERVDAAIRPGAAPGEAVLDLNVKARRPYDFAFTAANDTPFEIGETTGRFAFSARNLTFSGDELRGEIELSEGRRRVILDADAPLWPGGPTPFATFEAARSEFVRGPLSGATDARVDFLRLSAGVRVPLIETSRRQLAMILAFDWKRSKSFSLGGGQSFSDGPIGGVSRTAVLSLGQEFVDLGENRTIAIRATANFGLPILGATPNTSINESGQDGRFFSFIAQAQAAQRLTPELTLIARAQGQVASEALLPIESVAIGGRETVRGFSEASASGDDALVGSLEARIAAFDLAIPGFTPPGHDATFTLAPFIDAGFVNRREGGGSDTLVGVGAGFIWSPRPGVSTRFFFGAPLTDRPDGGGLQGEGAHFAVTLALP